MQHVLKTLAKFQLTGDGLRQSGRWGHWLPLPIAIGILIYFALPAEPSITQQYGIWGVSAICLGVGLYLIWRASRWAIPIMAISLVAIGFSTSLYRTHSVAAPVQVGQSYPVWISGMVTDRDAPTGRGMRITIRDPVIDELPAHITPKFVRISLKADQSVDLADRIRVRAILLPPPGPDFDGGYNFARRAWFDQLGAVGFSISDIEVLPTANIGNFQQRLTILRGHIQKRIAQLQPNTEGCILTALVIGDKSCIPEDVIEAWRISGLAHLLAISGLHMAIVAGFLFYSSRLVLVLIPGLALRYPIKKWAAIISLVGALGYLLVSGGAPPSRRAFIMVAVATLAILTNRRAISQRSLAVAATIILLATPEDLLGASFQMSYAATLALIGVYEGWSQRRNRHDAARKTINHEMPMRLIYGVWAVFVGTLVVSLVAGMATAPIAAQHFGRVANFGLLANAVAAPVASYLVMPVLAVGTMLIETLLSDPLFSLTATGLDVINKTAQFVAQLPLSAHFWPAGPDWVLYIILLGLMIMSLWRGWLCVIGLPIIAAASLSGFLIDRPVAWVAVDAKTIVVAPTATAPAVAYTKAKRTFSVESWLRQNGYGGHIDGMAKFFCDPNGCINPRKPVTAIMGQQPEYNGEISDLEGSDFTNQHLRLAISLHPNSLQMDCRQNDMVITAYPTQHPLQSAPTVACAAQLLPYQTIKQMRGVMIYNREGTYHYKPAKAHLGLRPWHQP